MTSSLAATRPESAIYRVGRRPDPWAWPPWSYAGEDGTFGNRYDDPRGEYRVLYASSQRLGAFIETLARYRTDPTIVAEYAQIVVDDPDQDDFPTIAPGVVPRDWFDTRLLGTARHEGAFADVGHSTSLAQLRVALAPRLVHYGLDDLDGSDLRRRAPRAFTQEVSRYVFEHATLERGGAFVGLRYLSRLGDDIVNWAIFEGNAPRELAAEEIARDDADLLAALSTLDLMLAS
jgi:hypothetical protein